MSETLPDTIWANHRLEWGKRTYVMGILNVTPDSFSGDGLISEQLTSEMLVERAVAQARNFVAEGATFIDVGGESTRPNFAPVSIEDELARVVPVIRALAQTLPPEIIISIDTYKAEVARQALDAGASMLNDIWALRRDPELAKLAAEQGVPVILMANMREFTKRDIVSDVIRFLAQSIDLALEAGIAWERIILDPGIGFGTTRKSTIGYVLGGLPPSERVEGTAATVALGIAQGADIVRVHDVHEMMRVVKMSDAIVRGTLF